MSEEQPVPSSFAYQAQTVAGQAVSGAVDAGSHEEARGLLQTMGLRPITLEPSRREPRVKKLSGDDFLAFNQQLAHLTGAGLPVERGLRLIAADMRGGRLRRTVNLVAEEMESGKSLSQAFDAHRGQFPPLYGRIVEAGVQTGRLPGLLLNLGRHLELVQRLQRELWRSLSYPLIIFIALIAIIMLLSVLIIPKFEKIFEDFDTDLPALTKGMLTLAREMPEIMITFGITLAVAIVLWRISWRVPWLARKVEAIELSLPLIGSVLRRNLMARWCDALRLGIDAGIDLPRAIELSTDAIDSPVLRRDGEKLVAALESGRPISDATSLGAVMPTVTASIDLASAQSNLAPMLASLSQMYRQEAELRMGTMNAIIAPFALVVLGATIGMVVLAMFLPLVRLITELT